MHGFEFECYYCGQFFARADKQKRHIENCSGVPGIICNFNNKNLITFEDSFKSKGDMPMVMYFDFETTAPTDNCFDPEQDKCLLCFMRAGWFVTKIYSHYTFEQEYFKKQFILMNQRSRQNAKNSIEKYFYKLMNKSNFGYDCCNNLDNCQFVSIFDELQEITYLKRYYNYFDSKISSFLSSNLIRQEIEEKYCQIKLSVLNPEKCEFLEAAENFDKKTPKKTRKK